MSPFDNANNESMLSNEDEKLSYFQNIAYARKEKPKKNGTMPIRNIKRFRKDILSVPVIRLMF